MLLIIFGLSLLILLEWILRLTSYGKSFDFVLQSSGPEITRKFSLNSQYVAIHYFDHLPIKLNHLFRKKPWFENTEFDYKKSKSTYRISGLRT